MRRKICVLLVIAILGIALACTASAASTAPYSLDEAESHVPSIQSKGKVDVFPMRRFYRGVSASNQWILQTRLNGIMINLQLFERNGKGVPFQENLVKASEGDGIQLILRQLTLAGNLLLQVDQPALDVLDRLGISEIAVVDHDYYIQNIYDVAAMSSVRSMLELNAGDELCVSGMEDPISVVDENGVRRIISE